MKACKWSVLVIAATFSLVVLAGSAWSEDTIKVGVVGPRTGTAAASF